MWIIFFIQESPDFSGGGVVEKGDSLLQGDYIHWFLSRKYSLKNSKNMGTYPPFQSKEHGSNTVISQR
jgi:hypothetical protein